MTGRKELSREEAARRIGCTPMQVLRMERDGRIRARRERPEGQHGRVWYDAEEVARAAKQYRPRRRTKLRIEGDLAASNERGRVAAVALPMFAQGRRLEEICAAAVADPLLVQQLYEAWRLGLEGEARREARRRVEEEERREQRRADQEARQRDYREWRVRMAAAGRRGGGA